MTEDKKERTIKPSAGANRGIPASISDVCGYSIGFNEGNPTLPVKFNGETVGTASNIKIDRTGALVGADLDLDPETKELIEKIQQAPKVQGNTEGLKWSWGSEMQQTFKPVGKPPEEPKPEHVTLESLAETMEELEKSRPMVKKSEFFTDPEQAPEWLADEFEIVDIHVSENVERGNILIVRDPDDLVDSIYFMLGKPEPETRKADRVIIFLHPEDLKK